MSPVFAAVFSLALLDTISLAGGDVRRTSLFGYRLGSGSQVLDLDEAVQALCSAEEAALSAACHASQLDPAVLDGLRVDLDAGLITLPPAPARAPRPALVRLERVSVEDPPPPYVVLHDPGEPAPYELLVELDLDANERALFTEEYEVRRLDVAMDDAVNDDAPEPAAAANDTDVALCPCGGFEEGHPCEDCAAALAALVDAESFDEQEPVVEEELPVAQARLCQRCNGGRRGKRGECSLCLNRHVRVWVAEREVLRAAPRTETGRLAACYALADLLGEIPDTAMKGAHELLRVALDGAEPATRTSALRQWEFARQRMVSALS